MNRNSRGETSSRGDKPIAVAQSSSTEGDKPIAVAQSSNTGGHKPIADFEKRRRWGTWKEWLEKEKKYIYI